MNENRYICVVDDHTMLRKGLCSLIDMFPGYKILFDAANGRDFIRQLKPPHYPDIVLLDITMPEMDGYDTAAWIRINLPDTAIIALSTMNNDAAIIRMIKNGARGYLLKNSEPEELKMAFHQIKLQGYYYNDIISRKVLGSISSIADGKPGHASFVNLTERETEFLKRICSEKTYKEIAGDMFLSDRTIDGYRESLFKKLSISTRVGLVLYAIKNGLVQP
ncbi:MAG: response regulator transcription factor [Chitinophagaceae bacterium]